MGGMEAEDLKPDREKQHHPSSGTIHELMEKGLEEPPTREGENCEILIKEEKEDPPRNQEEITLATIEEQDKEYWQQQYNEVRRLEEQLMAIQGFKEMDRQESLSLIHI